MLSLLPHNDGGLAAVRVFDMRASVVQRHDDRIVWFDAALRQERVQTHPIPKAAKRIDDCRRPVDASHETALRSAWTPTECNFNYPRNTLIDVHDAPVLERLHLTAHLSEAGLKMLLADDAEHRRLHWIGGD